MHDHIFPPGKNNYHSVILTNGLLFHSKFRQKKTNMIITSNIILPKIKLIFYSLILLAAVSCGNLLDNVYIHKTYGYNVAVIKRNTYAVHSETSSNRNSRFVCLNRCIAIAQRLLNNICAGITFRSSGDSTVCTMLYARVSNAPDLPTRKGADIIKAGGEAYWYDIQIGKIIACYVRMAANLS